MIEISYNDLGTKVSLTVTKGDREATTVLSPDEAVRIGETLMDVGTQLGGNAARNHPGPCGQGEACESETPEERPVAKKPEPRPAPSRPESRARPGAGKTASVTKPSAVAKAQAKAKSKGK